MLKKIHTQQDDSKQEKRYAVLVNDMLNDFIYGALKFDHASKIISKVKQLVDYSRQRNIPIVYCNDQHLTTDGYELDLWGRHAMKGTFGSRVIDDLQPVGNDLIIFKRRYSSFDGTSLKKVIRQMYNQKGANTLIMTGIHTHICIQHTAYDAFISGYKIIVAEDGVSAFTTEDHLSGLQYMKKIYGAEVEKTSKILKLLRNKRH